MIGHNICPRCQHQDCGGFCQAARFDYQGGQKPRYQQPQDMANTTYLILVKLDLLETKINQQHKQLVALQDKLDWIGKRLS
jgi:hypothetical protein